MQIGRVPKWTKGTDCKSVIRRFESDLGLSTFPPVKFMYPCIFAGVSSLAELTKLIPRWVSHDSPGKAIY